MESMAAAGKETFYPLYLRLSKAYLYTLEHIIIRLFPRTDIVVRSAYNTVEPYPEQIISNFFQGVYLSGKNTGGGLTWESTGKRAIITPDTARIRKRLQQYMKRGMFEIRYNTSFDEVISSCQRTDEWTRINEPLIEIYTELHEKGYAQSMEAYQDGKLVGGLWGLEIGRTFSIMSMYHEASHAGSIVLGTLVQRLIDGEFELIDCAKMNPNFRQFGAYPVHPEIFIRKVVKGFAEKP